MRARFGRLAWLLPLFPLLAATPSRAVAQQWLADRSSAQGAGIRVGDFELHPGIGAEVGYDSNVFNASGEAMSTAGGPPTAVQGAAILRVTPHLFLSTLGGVRAAQAGALPPAVLFSAGLQASYYHWFGDYGGTVDNLEGDANLHLVVNPQRPISLVLDERFSRTARPYTDNFGGTSPDYGRNTNVVGGQGVFSTSGGVLSARAGYNFTYDFFDSNSFNAVNNFVHNFVVGASYRFLPRTAIVYDLDMNYQTFQPGGGPASTFTTPNFRLATRVGLNGAVSTRLSASAMVGYGAGFYQDSRVADYESIVAQLELRWQITDSARLAFGYDRQFYSSFVGGFVRRDRGYVNGQLLIGGQFLLGAELGVGLFDFGTPLAADGTTPLGCTTAGVCPATVGATTARSDVMLTASIFSEYRFTNWLGVNLTLGYTGDFTDWHYSAPDPSAVGASILAPAKYNKFQAFLGIRVFL